MPPQTASFSYHKRSFNEALAGNTERPESTKMAVHDRWRERRLSDHKAVVKLPR
jgi:hypothetical protein